MFGIKLTSHRAREHRTWQGGTQEILLDSSLESLSVSDWSLKFVYFFSSLTKETSRARVCVICLLGNHDSFHVKVADTESLGSSPEGGRQDTEPGSSHATCEKGDITSL